jgi:DNA helicase-2/ATP-dependent DNA helicase PcrA
VDLLGEQTEVREAVRRTTYTGKTYNSLDHIAQFFAERGKSVPVSAPAAAGAAEKHAQPAPASRPANKPKSHLRAGAVIEHPKYGRGTVLRVEGDGEEAKLTVHFQGHGMKKVIAKYARIRVEG